MRAESRARRGDVTPRRPGGRGWEAAAGTGPVPLGDAHWHPAGRRPARANGQAVARRGVRRVDGRTRSDRLCRCAAPGGRAGRSPPPRPRTRVTPPCSSYVPLREKHECEHRKRRTRQRMACGSSEAAKPLGARPWRGACGEDRRQPVGGKRHESMSMKPARLPLQAIKRLI